MKKLSIVKILTTSLEMKTNMKPKAENENEKEKKIKNLSVSITVKSPDISQINKGKNELSTSYIFTIVDGSYTILEINSEYKLIIQSENKFEKKEECKEIEENIANILRIKITSDVNEILKKSTFGIDIPYTL
jgi:hypothetical protein|nr:MAG TPA: hypothetical protein [Caudoviricetes sp.]